MYDGADGYQLLDMGAFAGDDLSWLDRVAELRFRLEQRWDPKKNPIGVIDELIDWFHEHPDMDLLKPLFTEGLGRGLQASRAGADAGTA